MADIDIVTQNMLLLIKVNKTEQGLSCQGSKKLYTSVKQWQFQVKVHRSEPNT